MKTPFATLLSLSLAAAAGWSAAEPVQTRFSDDGVLESILIGETVFATGGGNLWEAEFVANFNHETHETHETRSGVKLGERDETAAGDDQMV